MPTLLPVRSKSEAQRKAARTAGIEVGAICFGFGAIILASFIYFSAGDRIAAALILILAAIVVLAMLRASSDPSEP